MKLLSTFLFILLLNISFYPHPGEDTEENTDKENTSAAELQPQMEDPCDWAVLFSWKPNFDVGKYYISSIPGRTGEGTPDKISVTGIGAEKYLSSTASIYGGLSIGIGGSSQENETTNYDLSSTEFGLKVGYNWYPKGVDARISPFFGPWLSASFYSESETFTSNGFENKDEFSASAFGIGVSGGAYVQFWDDIDLDFGAKYNLGLMLNPSSTVTQTSNGQSVESDGPSSWSLGDCGGQVMLRYSF